MKEKMKGNMNIQIKRESFSDIDINDDGWNMDGISEIIFFFFFFDIF